MSPESQSEEQQHQVREPRQLRPAPAAGYGCRSSSSADQHAQLVLESPSQPALFPQRVSGQVPEWLELPIILPKTMMIIFVTG